MFHIFTPLISIFLRVMSFNTFYSKTVSLFKFYILALLVFFFFRISQLIYFGNFNDLQPDIHSLLKGIWYGFRFDTLVTCYLLFPALIIILPLLFLKQESRYTKVSGKIISAYIITCLSIIVFILIIDFNYYKFFHTHFDNMFFGIFEDDTKAVLVSVWTDYPVILILIILTLALLFLRWQVRRIMKNQYVFPFKNLITKTFYVVLLFALFTLGIRGSLGTFPLGKDDMIICDNGFINDITPNGIFYLKETIVDRKRYKIDNSIEPILKKYHFPTSKEAIKMYLNDSCSLTDPLNCLETLTPTDTFLENNPPNIVFILMESLGTHYLTLHSQQLNLLGELEEQLKYCFVFKNFYPCANGTILSFEGILINSPSTPVSQSQYSNVPLKSSIALPYQKAGYKTSYLTGGKLGWRRMGIYTLNQYINEAEGNTEISQKVMGAGESTWGVYDEFLFERIYSKLEETNKAGNPAFIFALTVTNHTPYELPGSYKPYPVSIPKDLLKKIKTTEDIAKKSFEAYQYSNNYLGELIRKIRESDLGKNTIIAVTGDHNCRQLFEYNDKEINFHYGVPLILYVPEKYLKKSKIDTTRFGSHKDIFPTLYNLSLSSAKYVKSGNNLLSNDTSIHFYGINNYDLGIDKNGAVFVGSNLRYDWDPKTNWFVPSENPDKLNALYDQTRAQSFCMDYYVRSLLK